MRTEYDVIIIGAGPSGLSTALHLERYARDIGLDILILEKSRHPRVKLCAGGILPEGEAILARLGLDLREVPHTDVVRAYFDYKGRGLSVLGSYQLGLPYQDPESGFMHLVIVERLCPVLPPAGVCEAAAER